MWAISLRPILLVIAVAMAGQAASTNAASPTGRWRGSWTSDTSGHQGPLRARVWQVDENRYRALFVGRFAAVVPFAYPATLERVPGTCHHYTSSQRLPLLGRYRMDATITQSQFDAVFRGPRDYGVFQLAR